MSQQLSQITSRSFEDSAPPSDHLAGTHRFLKKALKRIDQASFPVIYENINSKLPLISHEDRIKERMGELGLTALDSYENYRKKRVAELDPKLVLAVKNLQKDVQHPRFFSLMQDRKEMSMHTLT